MINKSFQSRLSRFLIGRNDDLTREDQRRNVMIMIIGVIAYVVLSGVAVASWVAGDSLTAAIDYIASLCVATILLIFRYSSYKRVCRYVGVVLMYTLYLYLFFSGAANGNTYMWHYTFPFFAIFLIGANHGAIASLALFLPVFVNVIIDSLTPAYGYYSSQFGVRFIPSVSVALVFAFLFEKERERFRQQTLTAYQEQEQIIEERTQQLIEGIAERDRIAEKLRQSQKMEAIGTMASGVAHDLNNILSGIVTYPQLIRSSLPDDNSPLAEQLKSIEQAGKRAAAVVSDLLTIARNAASVKESFDINALIFDLLASPEWDTVAAQHPHVNIDVDLGATNTIMNCSPTHIRKSIMNLLINAIEATSPIGQVTISTRNMAREDDRRARGNPDDDCQDVVITIEDNGPGIAAKHVDHIFEPFYTTKKMGKSGSGLGLSVVWNTVEDHQGTINVENLDPGAKFEVRFPVELGVLLSSADQTLATFEKLGGSGSILVVDDEPDLRDIASAIVKKLGYTVSTVASGEEALAHIEKNHIDLVLLDMILGEGIGGFETYSNMIKLNPQQKAVIVSGYSSSEEIRQTLEMGAFAIIKKPYTLEEIGRVIKDCLENNPSHVLHG